MRTRVFLRLESISLVGLFPSSFLNDTHSSPGDDGNKLFTDYGIRAQGLVELGTLARQADSHYLERYFQATDVNGTLDSSKRRKPGAMMKLASVVAMYTGFTLQKGPVRMSNWEARPLNEEQLECAPSVSIH